LSELLKADTTRHGALVLAAHWRDPGTGICMQCSSCLIRQLQGKNADCPAIFELNDHHVDHFVSTEAGGSQRRHCAPFPIPTVSELR
jgi:hypothetical protein